MSGIKAMLMWAVYNTDGGFRHAGVDAERMHDIGDCYGLTVVAGAFAPLPVSDDMVAKGMHVARSYRIEHSEQDIRDILTAALTPEGKPEAANIAVLSAKLNNAECALVSAAIRWNLSDSNSHLANGRDRNDTEQALRVATSELRTAVAVVLENRCFAERAAALERVSQ